MYKKVTRMQFDAIFYPQSIAVIGASRTPGTVGNDIVKNLVTQGYEGKIFPVNPHADTIYDLNVSASVAAIGEPVDLAVIAIPAQFVPAALREAANVGARGAVIISAGFKEVGRADLEEEIAAIATETGVTIIGPNCLGVINPELGMNASFAGIMPKFGNIAFVSQSGALCSSVLDYAAVFSMGFSKFMSIGNKTCVDEITLLKYFAQDEHTSVIAMYVEQLENAPEFIKTAQAVTQGDNPKPIIILKSGRTSAGAAAIASHTGSLSGGDAAYEALFAQSGVIRANTIREFFEFIDIFSKNTLAAVKNVAIVTNAGGPGVLATDAVIDSGLTLSNLSEETVQELETFLPAAANTHNPIDILGDGKADRYEQTLAVLAKDKNVDALMVLLTPQTMTEVEETARVLIRFKQTCSKPVVASFMGKLGVDHAIATMEQGDVSTTTFPELAARGLAAMGKVAAWSEQAHHTPFAFSDVDTQAARAIVTKGIQAGQTHLSEADASSVLGAYGLPLLQSRTLFTPEEAQLACDFFDHPVALKIVSKDIVHKSEVGGVMLNVAPEEIFEKYSQLLERVAQKVPTAVLEGVLAVEMAPQSGMEIIVGANTHEGLGTVIMVGLGGIFVEVFRDVAFGYAPLSQEFASQMISSLKIHPILAGARGQSGYDIEAIHSALGRLSGLLCDIPEIKELDINPLLVLPDGKGVKVLDARIML